MKLSFKHIFLLMGMVFFLLMGNKVHAQGVPPTISASAYVVKVESNFNYNYDPYSNALNYPSYYSIYRSFNLLDDANIYYGNLSGSGTGTMTHEIYVSELKRPTKVSGYHLVDSVYNEITGQYCNQCDPWDYYCNPYDCTDIINPLENWTYYPLHIPNLALTYPYMDTTIVNPIYGHSLRVRVNPAGDNNFNLPSQDIISIKADNYQAGYGWEYEVLDANGNGVWTPVPSNLVVWGNTEVKFNGEQLFGWNWVNQLNKTVLFRLKKITQPGNITTTSNILVYTHRLSSPRITGITPTNNPCFGMDSASVDIQFSRSLMANEKLNILLKDSVSGIDYSALNLTNASFIPGTNTYKWAKELVAGNYRAALIGKYFDFATYTGSPDHFARVPVIDPARLALNTGQIPALCFGGNSGKVTVLAKGGVGNYKYDIVDKDSAFTNNWQSFVNPTFDANGFFVHTQNGLLAKQYKVRLRDGNNCKILDSNNVEISRIRTVLQPAQALYLPLLTSSPITAFNVADGSITARVAGGTPFIKTPENAPTYKKYQFEWRDSTTNALINNFSLDTNGKFETKIQNLAEGTYKFTAWDANYGMAPNFNEQGCRIIVYVRLTKPAPMAVAIQTLQPINCNAEANGKLVAVASGGIPVTDSLKYNFVWYKQINGVYTNLNTNDSTISNQSAGNYYVEIRDKNNYLKTSAVFTLVQPAALNTIPTSTQSTCYFTANGSMGVTPSGGTAPYTYEWSNGALTQNVNNVGGGTYFAVVKDSRLCQTTQQVIVTSPNKINTTVTQTPVGCNNSNNGAIALSATGGTGAFTYLWSTGATSTSINNLATGTYWYRINDANGCFDTDTITLDNPEPYTINAGPDRKLCIGQTINLTAVATATQNPLTTTWTLPNGSTVAGATIALSTTGNYIANVANGSGCIKKDTVVVTPQNSTVNTSFTVSTQAFAGENATLVNISPQLQDSVKWILPQGVAYTLISSSKSFCEVQFADTGVYTVGIKAYYANGCIDEKYKTVNVVSRQNLVNLGNQAEAFLKLFSIAPNPTTGSFTLNLLFNSVTPANVRIVNILTNVTISTKQLIGAASYSEQYNIGNFPAGVYIVIIETAKGNFIHKLTKS
jgi:SprB repeat/Secretion system C-terminal sorting domain